MSKLFLFVDESGDPGAGRDSSKYYQINIVAANHAGIVAINENISRLRYFLDFGKELKEYWSRTRIRKKVSDLVELILSKHGSEIYIKGFIISIEKQKYKGPFLGKNGKKFRNFILRKALEKIFIKINHSEYDSFELVIDRYLESIDEQNKLSKYIQDGYGLPRSSETKQSKIHHIIHIQSLYSDAVQLADIIGRLSRDAHETQATLLEYIDISVIEKVSSF